MRANNKRRKGNNSFCRLRGRTGRMRQTFHWRPVRDTEKRRNQIHGLCLHNISLSLCLCLSVQTDCFTGWEGGMNPEDHEAEGCQIPSSAHLMPFSSTPSFCLTIHSSLPLFFSSTLPFQRRIFYSIRSFPLQSRSSITHSNLVNIARVANEKKERRRSERTSDCAVKERGFDFTSKARRTEMGYQIHERQIQRIVFP